MTETEKPDVARGTPLGPETPVCSAAEPSVPQAAARPVSLA
jgi:hypothetical protein